MIGSLARRAARIVSDQPRSTMWTLLVLTCALIAVGIAGVAAENVDRWSDASRATSRGASMVVYLGDAVGDEQARAILAKLQQQSGVEHAELIGSDETVRRLESSLAGDKALFAGLDARGLPASIEVTFAPGVRDVVAMSPTVATLRAVPGVDDVVVEEDREPARAAAGSLATVRAVAWAGAGVFGGLALVVVLATIRVRLDRSRQERAVAHLLGADPSFFAFPTALAGAILTAVGALFAGVIIYWGIQLYGADIAGALSGTLGTVDVVFPPVGELGLFVAGAALLGLIGGALAGAGTSAGFPRGARATA